MKVLIVSEGFHELHGALPALVKRLVDSRVTLETRKVSDPCVRVHLRPGRNAKFKKRALAWLRFAERNGHDAIALVIDEDGDSQRQRDLDAAQDDEHWRLPRAFGVAIRTFDAWILADEQALTNVLGYQVDTQPSPESIHEPKSACENLLERGPSSIPQREMYGRVAQSVNLDLLVERCPRGFAPFAERVRALAQPD